MKQNDLRVFKLEREGFKLELEAQRPVAPVTAAAMPPAAIATQTVPANVTGSSGCGEEKSKLKESVSPMGGTFYRSPSPHSPPYAQPDQEINEEPPVCIIETMNMS